MSLNPILKSPKSILLYLLFVLAIAVLYINLITLEGNASFTIRLVDAIAFNLLIAALGLSFWYSSVYLSIENNQITKVILNTLWRWNFNFYSVACTWIFCCYKHYK